MKISCTPISMSRTFREEGMTLEQYIAFCAEIGIEAIDVLDSMGYPWQWKDKEKELKQLNNWLDKAGLKLAAYACGNNFTKKDDAEFEKNVEKVLNAIGEAARVGAPLLRIFGGNRRHCGGELSSADAYKRVIQGIERCLPEAEKRKVVLAIENHGCMPGYSFEINAIIRHFNSPYMKCMFDCANFMATNMGDEIEDTLQAYENLKSHVVHVHMKDFGKPADPARRVDACVTGKGFVKIRQFTAKLKENAYPGYCSLEYEAGAWVPEREGVKLSLEYLKDVRDQLKVL